MAGTLKERIVSVLQGTPNTPFLSSEVADKIMKQYPSEYERKGIDQLKREIGAQFLRIKDPHVKIVPKSSPTKRYWDNKETGEIPTQTRSPTASPRRKNKQPERELYDPLIQYLEETEQVKMFPITHQTTSGQTRGTRGRGKGVHPDIVGVQGVTERSGWDLQVQKLADIINPIQAKLWSFELKKDVTGNDVYTHYQQAVSNSSWANYGYLCVGDIDSSDTESKLRTFHSMHGIGVIVINKNDPMKSRFVIKANERPVDLNFCNTLAPNAHFRKFLTKAIDVYKTGNAF